MNYIRKKIKGHKKNHNDDDDDYFETESTANDSQTAKPEKDSEEWKFFQQLTQRVQDTVEKSQSTLNKLKDSSAVEDISKPDYEFIDHSSPTETVKDDEALHTASTSWVSFKEGQDGKSIVVEPQKPKPPRPPPAKAQAPPVQSVEPTQTAVTDNLPKDVGISLLEEFGFENEPISVACIPTNGLLILGDEEFEEEPVEDGDDPFDTTFADETLTSVPEGYKFQSPTNDDFLCIGGTSSSQVGSKFHTPTTEDFLGFTTKFEPQKTSSHDFLLSNLDILQPVVSSEPSVGTVIGLQQIDDNDFGTLDLEEEELGPDPFDTSFVNQLNADSPTGPPSTNFSLDFKSDFKSDFSADIPAQNIVANLKASPDNNNEEDMSNPFLPQEPAAGSAVGSAVGTPFGSAVGTPFGRRSRRMSTNPFEEDEDIPADLLGGDMMGAPFGNNSGLDTSIFGQIQNLNNQDTPFEDTHEMKVKNVHSESNISAFDLLDSQSNTTLPVTSMISHEDPFDPFRSSNEAIPVEGQLTPISQRTPISSTAGSRKPSNPEVANLFGFNTGASDGGNAHIEPMDNLFGISEEAQMFSHTETYVAPQTETQQNDPSPNFWDTVHEPVHEPEEAEEDNETITPLMPSMQPVKAVKDVISSLEKIASFAADDDHEVMDNDFVSMLSKRGSSDLSATSLNQGVIDDDQLDSTFTKSTEMFSTQVFSPSTAGNSILTSRVPDTQQADLFDSFSMGTNGRAINKNPFGDSDESIHDKTDISLMMSDAKGPMDFNSNSASTAQPSLFDEPMLHSTSSNLMMDVDPFDTLGAQAVLTEKDSSLIGDFGFEKPKDSIPITDTAAFEAFAAKFEQAIEKFGEDEVANMPEADMFDPFGGVSLSQSGQQQMTNSNKSDNFGVVDMFDPFLSMTKPPENTPIKLIAPVKQPSQDSFDDDDDVDFTVVIRPKMLDKSEAPKVSLGPPPLLPPPPKSPMRDPNNQQVNISRFNPFNKDFGFQPESVKSELSDDEKQGVLLPELTSSNEWVKEPPPGLGEAGVKKSTDSVESPTTPLYDEDTSMPLEEFPPKVQVDGWEMMLRQPNKKKITGNRFWKKVYIRLSENSILQLFNKKEDNDPFQELPLQACYTLSEVGAQQYDAYGKIFTVKLNYIFYRERVGVRPGQISKVMHGQITSVGQFAKLGLPLEHAPQVSQLQKIGTQDYADLKTFVQVMEDALFHLTVHRDRALTYKTEEVQITVHDELYVEQKRDGTIAKQNARVRLFFVAFISGMPDLEVGLNDLEREGKEVVGRYDIIPVVTEEWIRIENWEFHSSVCVDEFEKSRIVKLHPPDACYFELMRFRIRPPRNRELPLQIKCTMRITSMRVEMRVDVLVTGYHSRKHGQVPCEDIQIRLPLPECWIYLFRTEKHFRYGSLKSAARKPGKIKGLERIMGTAQSLDPSLIEVSCGQAKYEHSFKSIVWRTPRLPKEGQGAYTTQLLLVKLELTSFDQIPETFEKYVYAQFTMPATTVSHTTVRSVSVTNETPPEKYVKYLAKQEYRIEIDMSTGDEECEYTSAIASAMNATNQLHDQDDSD